MIDTKKECFWARYWKEKFLKDMIGVLVSAIRHLAGEIVAEQQNAFPRLWEGIRV